jgi:hypothetical protein
VFCYAVCTVLDRTASFFDVNVCGKRYQYWDKIRESSNGLQLYVRRYDFRELTDQANLVTAASCTVLHHIFVSVAVGVRMTK